MSKRQSRVSQSVAEAKVVAANTAGRLLGLPAQEFWETVSRRKVILDLRADTSAWISISGRARSPATRHALRAHLVQCARLTEVFTRPEADCTLTSEGSALQAADIFTKAFVDGDKWCHACSLIGLDGLSPPPPKRRSAAKQGGGVPGRFAETQRRFAETQPLPARPAPSGRAAEQSRLPHHVSPGGLRSGLPECRP